jgi:hypothetical protein
MIRRNHIDNGCKVDRDGFRNRPRQPIEIPSSNRPQRLSPELVSDENRRITSNNKKYYQYKEERESKSKPVQEFREESKPIPPLFELQQNSDLRSEHGLKREYTYDLEDTLKIDYNSISLKTHHQQEQKRQPQISHKADNVITNIRQGSLHTNLYNPSLDRTATPATSSPSKNRPAFQSSHKERYTKTFTPLFEETSFALKKEVEQSSSRR